ncbi:MAG: aryl-sulfate sulfotransferase, partial [Myxococcota bacterium]
PTAALDEDHPSVVWVRWTAPPGAVGQVTFGVDGAADRATPPVTGPDQQHRLLGLKAGHEVAWSALVDGQLAGSGVIAVPPAPPQLPTLVVDAGDGSSLRGRYVLVAGADEAAQAGEEADLAFLGIFDADGDWVWWHLLPPGLATNGADPSADGNLVYLAQDDARQDPDSDLVEITLDGEVVGGARAVTGHHAMTELDGDSYAYLGRAFLPQPDGSTIVGDEIDRVHDGDDGSGAETVFGYVDDWWGGLDGYWGSCPPLEEALGGYTQVCDLTHSNSLEYLPETGLLYAMARLADTMLAIDPDSGALVWQLGGRWSDFALPDGTSPSAGSALWSGPHFSHVWRDGMVAFDNGVNRDPPVSSVVELSWDEATGTVTEVFRYVDPDHGYTPALGDVRKLLDGHYVATWMTLDKVTELDPAGALVWEAEVVGSANLRRIRVLDDLYDLTRSSER